MPVSTTTKSYFDCCREGLDELLATHHSMRLIECTIDSYALDDEEKDALWLWANGRRDRLDRVACERPTVAAGDAHD